MLLLAYTAAVVVLFPVYLHVIIPLALDLYGASDVTFGVLLLQSRTLLLGLAVVLLLCLRRTGWAQPRPVVPRARGLRLRRHARLLRRKARTGSTTACRRS